MNKFKILVSKHLSISFKGKIFTPNLVDALALCLRWVMKTMKHSHVSVLGNNSKLKAHAPSTSITEDIALLSHLFV